VGVHCLLTPPRRVSELQMAGPVIVDLPGGPGVQRLERGLDLAKQGGIPPFVRMVLPHQLPVCLHHVGHRTWYST